MLVHSIIIDACGLMNLLPTDRQDLEHAACLLRQGGLTVHALVCSSDSELKAQARVWCQAMGWKIFPTGEVARDVTSAGEVSTKVTRMEGVWMEVIPTGNAAPAPALNSCSDALLLTSASQVNSGCLPAEFESTTIWLLGDGSGPGEGNISTSYSSLPAHTQSPAAPFTIRVKHLLQELCRLQTCTDPSLLIVGYVMSPKRERELSASGLLTFTPIDNMIFTPLSLDSPMNMQPPFHILLHKFSDELVNQQSGRVDYSERVYQVIKYLSTKPEVCIVDPLRSTSIVIDRLAFTNTLARLLIEPLWGGTRFALPQSLVVGTPEEVSNLPASLTGRHMVPPFIVKRRAACGVTGSHAMMLIRSHKAWPAVQLSLPSVIQQYVNHRQVLYKVYVLGEHVKVTKRKSIPDITTPSREEEESAELSQLYHEFDSLASMPYSGFAGAEVLPPCPPGADGGKGYTLSISGVEAFAAALRQELGLRLFGFDVVVCRVAGTHYVVDLNYFPNYREVEGAPGLLRRTLLDAYAAHKRTLA